MSTFMELIARAPWREAVTYRHTWPHEYVLTVKDNQRELLDSVCTRLRAGEGVAGRFFPVDKSYLFIGGYKYWLEADHNDVDPYNHEDDYVLNRARLYRDRRDFVIQEGDSGRPEDYPANPAYYNPNPSNGGGPMAEGISLLAYLVPNLTDSVEDTATEALAFILNKSAACRDELVRLVTDGDFTLAPIVKIQTQVMAEDGSSPDMVGYDRNDAKRLIVEAKFWATLQPSQGRAYLAQLEEAGPGVLLFIAPDTRIESLWDEITSKLESDKDGMRLDLIETADRTRRARTVGPENRSNKRVMLVSWPLLLDRLASAVRSNFQVASDIQQLRGLAQMQDDNSAETGPPLPFSIHALENLINDVVVLRGRREGWILNDGKMAVRRKTGYGRYFGFTGLRGDIFLCINHYFWSTSAGTPVWLQIYPNVPVYAGKLEAELYSPIGYRGAGEWRAYNVPIFLKAGVEYEALVNDVIRQLQEIAATLVSAQPSQEPKSPA